MEIDSRLERTNILGDQRKWEPTPIMRATMYFHAVAPAIFAADTALGPYLLAAIASNHALLAAFMRPRSSMLGPNMTQLSAPAEQRVALTFDDGPDPRMTPRVLDILDEIGATATFFVIGERAKRHPEILRSIVSRGHAVGNHTHTHPPHFA